MVSLFKNIAAHKEEVLALYKTLLRHTTHLPELSDGAKAGLIQKIRYAFRDHKGHVAGPAVRRFIEEGYELEDSLRRYYHTVDPDLIQKYRQMELPPTQRTIVETRLKKQLRLKYPPRKPKGDKVQSLEKQREASSVANFLKLQRKRGLIPKVIDSEILEQIVKPEALFLKAKIDIKSIEQKLSRGPYKVHPVYFFGFYFLRDQTKRVSRSMSDMILKHNVRKDLLGVIQPMVEYNTKLGEIEDLWDDKITEHNPNVTKYDDQFKEIEGYDSSWTSFIKSSLRKYAAYHRKVPINHFRDNVVDKLPKEIIERQASSNRIHNELASNYAALIADVNGVTAHDDILGLETLPEIVNRHNLVKRKV